MTTEMTGPYLAPGLPCPRPTPGLDDGFWDAARKHQLVVQRCTACGALQWEPECVCHNCQSFELDWQPVSPRGKVYTWERVWHPVHSALRESCPYLVVVVELADAEDIRMVGNLLGDPEQEVTIGQVVEAVFEDRQDPDGNPFTLVQWKIG